MDLIDIVSNRFQQRFGKAPAYIAFVPGRVNLLGEHVNYNAGFVVPGAIDQAMDLAFSPAEADLSTLVTADFEDECIISPENLIAKNDANGVVGRVGALSCQHRLDPFTNQLNYPPDGGCLCLGCPSWSRIKFLRFGGNGIYDGLVKIGWVDLEGKVVQGNYRPSSDVFAHVYVYRNRPDVNGVVHTHSTFATAWAADAKPIPSVLTAICDRFGGPVPVGAYAKIGSDEIGREIIRSIGESPAILMKNHEVFSVGKTAEAAVKAAVMVEDVARTVFYTLQLGHPDEIPADEVIRAHHRYLEVYGQS